MDVNDMVDRIQGMTHVFDAHGYKWVDGGGIKPWSHKHTHPNGSTIDVRANDWTYYKDGVEIQVGRTPAELDEYLNTI